MTISGLRQQTFYLTFLVLWSAQSAHAVDFDNGLIKTISSTLLIGGTGSVQDALVFDSLTSDTTTLNVISGAEINGFEACNSSIVKV